VLLLVACSPPADECSATKPCAAGFVCAAGRCEVADGGGGGGGACADNGPGAKNLLPNPGFECGDPPDGWIVTHGKLSVIHVGTYSGTSAARISNSDGNAELSLWLQPDAVTNPGTKTYCTRAFMRGSSVGRLTVRKVVNSSYVNDDSYSSPVTANWVVVPPPTYGAMKVVGASEQRFLLRAWIPNPTPADWLEVDDVQLWESADGGCANR
jgi:hypothetical protein